MLKGTEIGKLTAVELPHINYLRDVLGRNTTGLCRNCTTDMKNSTVDQHVVFVAGAGSQRTTEQSRA